MLRDGLHVGTHPMRDITQDDIVRMMVGHDVEVSKIRPVRPEVTPILRVDSLTRGKLVQNVSFSLQPGEIFGIAGLVGAGRTELLRLIYGADRKDSGEIYLNGADKPTQIRSPMEAIKHGIGLITEDRKSQSLLLDKSIKINTTLARLTSITRRGWLNALKEESLTQRLVDTLGIRCNSLDQPTGELSGGNQQKVVFARWMLRDSHILLLDEPTRGVDIGSRADIYVQMEQMAAQGKALLVVSSDLRELMEICDRIGVMSAGHWVNTYTREQWDQQTLLEAAFSGHMAPAHTPLASETQGQS